MKTKKELTESYLQYRFSSQEHSESIPEWLDDLDIMLANKEEIFGPGVDIVQPIVYTLYDTERHPLYVGKSIRFNDRMRQHMRNGESGKEPWMAEVMFVGLICCDTLTDMDIIEILEIQKKLPRHVSDFRHDTADYFIPLCSPEKQLQITVSYSEDVIPYSLLWEK